MPRAFFLFFILIPLSRWIRLCFWWNSFGIISGRPPELRVGVFLFPFYFCRRICALIRSLTARAQTERVQAQISFLLNVTAYFTLIVLSVKPVVTLNAFNIKDFFHFFSLVSRFVAAFLKVSRICCSTECDRSGENNWVSCLFLGSWWCLHVWNWIRAFSRIKKCCVCVQRCRNCPAWCYPVRWSSLRVQFQVKTHLEPLPAIGKRRF